MDDNFFSRNVNLDPWDYNVENNNSQRNRNQYYKPTKYDDYSEHKNNAGRYNRDDNRAKSDNKLMMVSVAFSSLSFLMAFILSHAKIVTLLNIFVIVVLFLACVFAVIGIITAIKVLKKGYAKESSMAIMSIIFALMSFSVFGYHMLIFLFGILF